MFQVEPERVFFALGAPKDRKERQVGRRLRAQASRKSPEANEEGAEAEEKEAADASIPAQPLPSSDSNSTTTTTGSTDRTPKKTLQSLLAQAKTLLATPSTSITARRKQDLRTFQRTVKKSLSRPDALTTTSLDAQLQEILSRMAPTAQELSPATPVSADDAPPQMSTPSLQAEADSLNPAQMRVLRDALTQARENPIDASKPYATPWRPRDFMSPFAFIPNYLEVHQKVCSAVYIRHPVARPGMGEVPTPFHAETLGLAHNWYLRRR